MKKQAVIFDSDGLLIDTEKYYTISWKMALNDLGYEISSEEVQEWSGLNWRKVSAILAERYDEKVAQQAVDKREEELLSIIRAGKIEAKPKAKEVLETLKKEGYRLALASSGKTERAVMILEKLGFLPYFETTIFGDDVENNKPAPDCYNLAVERLGVDKNEAVAVEDSMVGLTAAKNAGLDAIAIPDSSLRQTLYSEEEIKDLSIVAQGKDLSVVLDYLNQK